MASGSSRTGEYRVVLPMLDEAAALPALLEEMAAVPGLLERAVFVDNGSSDGSAELVRAAGGLVVPETRRGYGFACLAGVRAALTGASPPGAPSGAVPAGDAPPGPVSAGPAPSGAPAPGSTAGGGRSSGRRPAPGGEGGPRSPAVGGGPGPAPVRVLVFMEADGSDDPADLPRLVGPVLDGSVDLMVGSRRRAVRAGASMPPHQRLGNAAAVVGMRLLYGVRLPDNGPFRAVRADLLEALAMEPRGYAWTTEMVVKAHLAGARIEWSETAFRARAGRSKISGTIRGTVGAFRGIFGTLLRLRVAGGRRSRRRSWPPPGS